MSVDWLKIKNEYVNGNISYRKLAEKHGVSASALMQKAAKEKWAEEKEHQQSKTEAKTKQKTEDKISDALSDEAAAKATIRAGLHRLAADWVSKQESVEDTNDFRRMVQSCCDLGIGEEFRSEEKAYELPARVIGKAFVDLNRQIVPNIAYVLEGGRGSLKSSFWAFKIIELIKNNPELHACITRQVGATLKDSVYAQMKWAINTLGLSDEFECKVSPLEIHYKKTGQVIYFRGLDDETKLKSIKPTFGYIGILWKEEKDQMKGPAQERSVNQSVLRGGNISYDFSSYNPPKSKANWVNQEKLEPNEKRVIHSSTYLDAPAEWLGQKFIEDAEHLKEVNPEAYEHEYLGIPNGDGGNVFDNLIARTITDAEIRSFDRIYQGVDWGWYPDPFAFIRLHYDKARETIYLIDEIYENKLSNEASGAKIKEKGYTDAYVTCDSAEHKSTADYRAMGIPAKDAVKGPGSVEYGMKWLQRRKIVIDPARTPHAYKEFTNYEYERSKDGDVISGYPDKDNHLIDAVRYALERVFNKYGSGA